MTAYRLYSKAAPGRFQITLVHGNPNQKAYDLFDRQILVRPFTRFPLSQAAFIHAGRRWMRAHAHEFDIFHGLQGFDLTVLPALAAQRRGLPAFVKLAAHHADLADKAGWKRLLGRPRKRREVLKQLSGVIAISTAIRDELLSYGIPESRIALIPNGVDTDQFRPPADEAEKRQLREQLGWRPMPTLLFAGGINRRKRPHLLVEALVALRQAGVTCQLVLVGPADDPAYLEQMREAARGGGVEDQVIEAGFTPDIAPLYRAADFFALPSSSEGLPNALLEAMATGLACLVTSISGSADLVEDDVTGRLVEPTAADIAARLREYLDAPVRAAAHGRAALERIRAQYSAAVVLDQHEKLFRAALRR